MGNLSPLPCSLSPLGGVLYFGKFWGVSSRVDITSQQPHFSWEIRVLTYQRVEKLGHSDQEKYLPPNPPPHGVNERLHGSPRAMQNAKHKIEIFMWIISCLGQRKVASRPIFKGMDRDFLSGSLFQSTGTKIVQQHLS